MTAAEWALFSFGAGSTALGGGMLALGLAGLVHGGTVAALFACGALWGLIADRRDPVFSGKIPEGRAPRAAALAAAAVFALAALPALAPPVGNDALAYHLAYPKIYIESGRISHLPYTWESLWPAQTEMFFMAGLLFGGTSLAQLFHWVFYPLTALLTFAFASRYWSRRAALLAAASAVLTPAAFAQAGYAYVDLALAFYVSLSLYAYLLKGEIGERRAALLSGTFAGAALATKYLALGTTAVLGLFWVGASGRRIRNASIFAASAIAVSAVWYLRSWAILGNPVFPFFHTVFGDHGFQVVPGRDLGFDKGPLGFLLLGWNATMSPERFGGTMLGPHFLMFLPLLIPRWRGARTTSKAVVIFTAGCAAFIFLQAQQNRFFLTLLPWLATGTGVACAGLLEDRSRILRRTAFGALLVWTAAALGIYGYRAQKALPVVAGLESADSYLARHERSYQGYRYLDQHASERDRVFNHGDNRRFFSRTGQVVWNEDILRKELASQGKTISDLLEKERYEFIWIDQYSDPAITAYMHKESYQKVFSYTFVEGGFVYEHQIYHRP